MPLIEELDCTDRTLFLVLFGFYVAWMMGIAVLAYNKLKGSTDYATHFVGRKDYGILVMALTMYASTISGNSVVNNPNTAAGLGYMCFWIINVYTVVNMGFATMYPRMRRLSVERKWNSFSDILSDRFTSRPTVLSVLPFPCCGLCCYVVAQLWAFRETLPVVSAGYISKNPVTIIITIVIYICESMGGFDAVSYTDVVQGLIIIVALLVGPLWMTSHFGPLDGTVQWGCDATWVDEVVDEDENTTEKRLRGCYAYIMPWNVLHPAGKTYSYFNKPKWPDSYGIDGAYWFNNTCWIAFANYMLFYGAPIFPHVVQRVFASRTDESCKQSMMLMAICMCLAGMPGLILGFFYAIHLRPEYPAATPAFGAILDYMMRQGGLSEFMGVMAACGGLAAIMSTIDSTTLACTNIVTKEVVVNDLARCFPQLVEPRIMTIIERGTSGAILGMGMFFTTYYIPILVEDNPLEATLMMNRLAFYQFGFIVQAWPLVMCALFPERIHMRPLPAFVGMMTSLIVLPVLSVSLWEVKGYGTPKPEILDSIPNLYLHPSNVACVCNCFLMFGGHAVLPDSIANLTSSPDRQVLQPEEIFKIMEGTIEPFLCKPGAATMMVLFIMDFFTLPWYGASYNSCDCDTYEQYNKYYSAEWNQNDKLGFGGEWTRITACPGRRLAGGTLVADQGGGDGGECVITTLPPDCEPEPDWNSMPQFGGILFTSTVLSFALNVVCFSTWKPRKGAIEPGSQELKAMQLPADQAAKHEDQELGKA